MSACIEQGILFLHVCKTGGWSVSTYLCRHFGLIQADPAPGAADQEDDSFVARPCRDGETPAFATWPQHRTYAQLREQYGDDWLAQFHTVFTVVRCPYTRCISDLLYLRLMSADATEDETLAALAQLETRSSPALEQHATRQAEYVDGVPPERLRVLRQESLAEDMASVMGFVDFTERVNVNRDGLTNYERFLTPRVCAEIERLYACDFDRFGFVRRTCAE